MEWFREVLESLPDATVVIDEDGRIVFLNPQTETLFGYSRDELLGQSIEQLVPPSFREKHAGHRSGYFSTPLQRSNGSNIEFYGLRKDGTDFPIEVSFGSIRGDQGSFVTEIIRDVTCRKGWEKEHQLQLLSTGDVIEAVAQPKTDFLANIAHRMRTPLNAIIGTSELLTLTDMTPQQRRQSVIIQSSGELLLSIINDILDFLKISAHKLVLEEVNFNFIEMVESLVDSFAAIVRGKDIELVLSLDPEVPAGVRADPGRIRQILSHLLSNAVKFTSAGEIMLRVTLLGASGRDLILRFELIDTGIGMTREAQSRLFQPFVQANESDSQHYASTGLGLVIAQQLVESMGGHIEVASEPGKGSNFHFELHLKKGAEIARPWLRNSIPAAFKDTRALIVSDSAFNRQVLSEYLTSWTIANFAVRSGTAALNELRLAAEHHLNYNLMLLDDKLPDITGLNFSQVIRENSLTADTRMIMMSTDPDTISSAENMESLLTKPICPSVLFNCLRHLLEGDSTQSSSGSVSEVAALTEIHKDVHVLVVEDNPANQTLTKAQLNSLGYNAEIVGDAWHALDALLNTRYDIVLMDCELPGMSGLEATSELRRREGDAYHTAVIALTAHATEADRRRCLEAGMDGYLAKPTKLQALAKMLDRWHGKSAMPAQLSERKYTHARYYRPQAG